MESIDFWKFHEDLTVVQATLLIIGRNPSREPLDLKKLDKVVNFDPVFCAITTAIRNEKLNAILHYKAHETNGFVSVKEDESAFISNVKTINQDHAKIVFKTEPDWGLTTVNVNDLKAWLLKLNFPAPFFFNEKSSNTPDYLDPIHPRHSQKLAASIKAWQAMDDDNLLLKKTPKKAMEAWLQSRYKELGLEHNGQMNNSAISECATVANWQTKGGAPST